MLCLVLLLSCFVFSNADPLPPLAHTSSIILGSGEKLPVIEFFDGENRGMGVDGVDTTGEESTEEAGYIVKEAKAFAKTTGQKLQRVITSTERETVSFFQRFKSALKESNLKGWEQYFVFGAVTTMLVGLAAMTMKVFYSIVCCRCKSRERG